MSNNVIVGQSGGPTAVINSSLAGVYKTARSLGADTVYGMKYGIEGLLKEEMVDLDELLDDPVKNYLKQIGQIPLLSAEQEVDLSKRIHAVRVSSATTFNASKSSCFKSAGDCIFSIYIVFCFKPLYPFRRPASSWHCLQCLSHRLHHRRRDDL